MSSFTPEHLSCLNSSEHSLLTVSSSLISSFWIYKLNQWQRENVHYNQNGAEGKEKFKKQQLIFIVIHLISSFWMYKLNQWQRKNVHYNQNGEEGKEKFKKKHKKLIFIVIHTGQYLEVFQRNTQNNTNSRGRSLIIYHLTTQHYSYKSRQQANGSSFQFISKHQEF